MHITESPMFAWFDNPVGLPKTQLGWPSEPRTQLGTPPLSPKPSPTWALGWAGLGYPEQVPRSSDGKCLNQNSYK
jgi:hypothetical protein